MLEWIYCLLQKLIVLLEKNLAENVAAGCLRERALCVVWLEGS